MRESGRVTGSAAEKTTSAVTINAPTLFDYDDDIPFDVDDTLNFDDVIVEYLGRDAGEERFLVTAADGAARVSLPPQQNETTFAVGAHRYRMKLAAPLDERFAGRLTLTPLDAHRRIARN